MKHIDLLSRTKEYQWEMAPVGGVMRVRIQNAEDLRHLNELDPKRWTVLSCPTQGLEVGEQTLSRIDIDKDNHLHLDEVIKTSQWLCQVLKDPQTLFANTDEVALDNIQDADILAIAKQVAGEKTAICLNDVQAAIDAVTVPTVEPTLVEAVAPYEADVMATYHEKKEEIAKYFELAKMAKLGLVTIPEDVVKPTITEAKFLEMGEKIAAYEAAVAANAAATTAAADATAAALQAAKDAYEPLFKLILLHRDFYIVLRNYVTFEDFYSDKLAMFQAGKLVIDQRICHLVMRVNDMGKQNDQAPASGMFLIYCDCVLPRTGETMQIVAAMTQGEIRNLTVGKNAIFYDRQGNDWNAIVTKIIDNPISIKQAFWSPYRKFAKWVQDLVNKSAAEKDAKALSDLQAKTQATIADPTANPADKKAPFDIAKFAGIFAAIGMAVGYIGAFFTSLASGINALPWWQLLIWIAGLMLVISGPSMILAWLKLRKRNLAPILNANGWAINADAIINVPFGAKLTEMLPLTLVKKKLTTAGKWWIAIAVIVVVVAIAITIWKLCPCVSSWCPCLAQ